MRKWIKASATTAFLAAGMFALGAGAAQADVETSGNGSVLSGNQAVGEVNVPVNVSGNAVGVLGGVAFAEAEGASASVSDPGHDNITTSGDGSVGSGNQIVGELNAPINVCGNAVAGLVGVAGASAVDCEAGVGDGGDDNGYDNGYDDYGYDY